MWNEGLETAEERKGAMGNLQQSAVLEMEQIDREFRGRAREYRRERVEWEMSLVKNEWVKRKIYSLFRPGTTVWMVYYAMRLGRGDLEREGGQVDGDGTLEVISPEVEREMKGVTGGGVGGQEICVSLVESLLAVFSLATVVNFAKARMLIEDFMPTLHHIASVLALPTGSAGIGWLSNRPKSHG